jgi:hypothetical protein
MRRYLSFPDTVSETSARLVATGVVLQAVAFLVLRSGWVLVPLTYGFLARVASGPRFSPLGLLVTKVIAPRLPGEPKIVPGPPKRFAQGIGATFTVSASIAWLLGAHSVSYVLLVGLLGAASLEAFAGFCLGCVIFGRLMRWGVVPDTLCEECNDISRRLGVGTQV